MGLVLIYIGMRTVIPTEYIVEYNMILILHDLKLICTAWEGSGERHGLGMELGV